MYKVRVRATVRAAYNFFTSRFGQIISVCAVPFATLAIIDFLEQSWIISLHVQLLSGDQQALPSNAVLIFVGLSRHWADAALVGLAAAGLHRMVLFERPIPPLSFGPTERRFVLLSVLFVMFMQAPFFIASLTADAIFGPMQAILPHGGFSPDVAAGLRARLPLVWIGSITTLVFAVLSIRVLQMFPVSVVEHRLSPARSWALTRGNWWRTVGCYVLAFLPILIFAWIGLLMISSTLSNGGQYPSAPLEFAKAQRAVLWISIAYNTIIGLICTALGVGILSYSYKQLTGLPLNAAVDHP